MAINNEDFSSDQIANKFLVSKENGMTYWDEIDDRAVTNIGGVTGPITLGSGLSITEDGELSAQGGGGGTTYEAGNGIIIEDDTISVNSSEVPVFNEDLENVGTLNVNNVTVEEDSGVTHFYGSSYELGGDRTDFNLVHSVVMGDPESDDVPAIVNVTGIGQQVSAIDNYSAVNLFPQGQSGREVTAAEADVFIHLPDAQSILSPDDLTSSIGLSARSNKGAAYNPEEPSDEWVNLGYDTGASFSNGRISTGTQITRGIPYNEQEKETYEYYERTPEENDFNNDLQNIEFYNKGVQYYQKSGGLEDFINYDERINYSGRDVTYSTQNSSAQVFIGSDNIGEFGIMNLSVALDQSTETDDNNIIIDAGVLSMNESEAPKPRVAIVVTNDSPDGTAMNAVDVSADDVTIMNMGTSDNSVATKKYVDDHSGGGSTDTKSLKLVSSKNVSLSDFITFEQGDFLDPSVVYFNDKYWLFAPSSYIGSNHAIFSEDGGRIWKTANITGNYPRNGGHTVKVLNNQLVMISPYDSYLYVSNDGIAWESKNVPTPESGTAPAWVDIEYVGNKYVMIGRDRVSSSDPTDPFGLMAVSEDLSNWYQVTLPGKDNFDEQPATWLSLATCQLNGTSYLVATSADNNMKGNIWFINAQYITPNLLTNQWRSSTIRIKNCIAYNVNDKIIIIGNNTDSNTDRIVINDDGSLENWLDLNFSSTHFSYSDPHYAHPYYINGKYYVASDYLISTDGEIDPSGSGETVKCEEVGYIDLTYVADMAIGQNGIVAIQYNSQDTEFTTAQPDMINLSDNGVLWGGQGGVFQGDVDVTQMLREILNPQE